MRNRGIENKLSGKPSELSTNTPRTTKRRTLREIATLGAIRLTEIAGAGTGAAYLGHEAINDFNSGHSVKGGLELAGATALVLGTALTDAIFSRRRTKRAEAAARLEGKIDGTQQATTAGAIVARLAHKQGHDEGFIQGVNVGGQMVLDMVDAGAVPPAEIGPDGQPERRRIQIMPAAPGDLAPRFGPPPSATPTETSDGHRIV